MLIFTHLWTKTIFIQIISKNIVFIDMLIFSDIRAKTTFSKCSQNNVLFLEMSIFTDQWKKQFFLNDLKNVLYCEILMYADLCLKNNCFQN